MANEWNVVSERPAGGEWNVVSERPAPPLGQAQKRYRETLKEAFAKTPVEEGVAGYASPATVGAFRAERRTPEQLRKEWTQAAVGGAASYPGVVGDIEALGRAGLGYIGAEVSPETWAPTTEQIGEWIAGQTGLEPEGTPAEIERLEHQIELAPEFRNRRHANPAGRA